MRRRLPPLNAVKGFEAAARNKSFTRAADELHVTPGAVSQQVKLLEEPLGVRLFNRERQRLLITESGREYLAVVLDALDQIAEGTERIVRRQRSSVLTVSVSPDFAAKWLVSRLGRFAETLRTLISGFRQPITMSISHARMSTLQFVMATALGPGSTSCDFASSSYLRFAAQSSLRDATAYPLQRTC
jgi:LysR family transcriptional regulator, glycine cleavage system transcriptional activator